MNEFTKNNINNLFYTLMNNREYSLMQNEYSCIKVNIPSIPWETFYV